MTHETELSPGFAQVVFVLIIPVYQGNISQRGHNTILPPSANKDTSILSIWMKLLERDAMFNI